jgi:hypothetical protein
MSKQFEQFKLAFIKNKIQVLILNSEGWVQDSCDSIFELNELKKSIFDYVPLFEKIKNVLTNLELNQSITLEKCDWDWDESVYFLDIEITKYLLDNEPFTRLILEDKTFDYESLEEAQTVQAAQVSGEHTELLNTILQLKKELQNTEKTQEESSEDFQKAFLKDLQNKFEEPLLLIQSWLNKSEVSTSSYLTQTSSAVNFLDHIIHKPSYFTGIEKGISNVENKEFSLKNLLNEMLIVFDYFIKEKEIDIKFDYPDTLPSFFKGRKKHLEYLFFHLFFSILKYCSKQELIIKVLEKSFEGDLHSLSFEFSTKNRFTDDVDVLGDVREQNLFIRQVAQQQGGSFDVLLVKNNLIFQLNLELISIIQLADNQQDKSLSNIKIYLLSKQKSAIELISNYCEQLSWDLEVSEDKELLNTLTKTKDDTKIDVLIVDIDTIPLNDSIKIQIPILTLVPFLHDNLRKWLSELGLNKHLKTPFSKKVFYDKVTKLLIKPETMYSEKIDLSYIEDIVEDNPEMLVTLLEMLLDNIKEYPDKMSSEFHSEDFYQLRETAHKFKSCTAYTGLVEFNEVLTQIERSEEFNLSNSDVEEKVNFISTAAQNVQLQVEEKLDEIKQEDTNETEV